MRFCSAIETTVKELIPVQQILQTYMSQESRDIDLDGEIEDTIDPDVVDELDTPMEARARAKRNPSAPVRLQPIRGGRELEAMHGLANEFKTVPGVHTQPEPEDEPEPSHTPQPQPQGEDEGVLFGDAPEQRTKKLAYN